MSGGRGGRSLARATMPLKYARGRVTAFYGRHNRFSEEWS